MKNPVLTDSQSMDKNGAAPCEVCGGLLPLKPIQKRRRSKQRQSPSLQSNQEENSQSVDVSRSKDSNHFQTELGVIMSHNENKGDVEYSLPPSDNSDRETEESSIKNRKYDLVLKEIQAIFAVQTVKKEPISSYMDLYKRQMERESNKLKQHERCQAHLPVYAISQHASTSKSRSPARPSSPGRPQSASGVNLPCLPRPYSPICKRVVGQLPPEDTSSCSFDPLRLSPSPRVHATQSCTHQLDEHSKRKHILRGATSGRSSPPCSLSTKQKNHKGPRGADDHHQEACRPTVESSAERNTQPSVDNNCYNDVLRLYKECQIHKIDDHITETLIASPRDSRNPQRRSYVESGFQTQPQQIIYSCHQHVCQQTVVRHHEDCPLHQRDGLELPRAMSPSPRDSRMCHKFGCKQQGYSTSLQRPADCKTCYHSLQPFVKTVRSSEQEVTVCTRKLSSCSMHVGFSQQKIDVCGVLHQDRNCPICKHPYKDHAPSPVKGKIMGCHLHSEPPKCQEHKDPLIWTPRRMWKPKPNAMHWLDRITASQKIPCHIVRQYLEGKRRCPPRWKKQKCFACVWKSRDGKVPSGVLCQREVKKPAWNSGSDIAESTVECKDWKESRKLSRLALSRVLIVKPVPKVSTSQGLWTRKEYEVCSECRDLKLFRSVGIRRRRWSSILETMSSTGLHDGGDMSSNCSTKFSCHTIHGLPIPGSTDRPMDLCGPQMNSAFRLRRKLQKIQNEKFDRRAAMQARGDLPY